MSVLVLAEHDNGSLKDATLNAVTAAKALAGFAGGDVHVLVAGKGAQAAADAAAKVEGVGKVLLAEGADARALMFIVFVLVLLVLPQGIHHIAQKVPELLEDARLIECRAFAAPNQS